jgi:hypothetical protein
MGYYEFAPSRNRQFQHVIVLGVFQEGTPQEMNLLFSPNAADMVDDVVDLTV